MKNLIILIAAITLAGCAIQQPDVAKMGNAELCNTKGQALGFANGPLLESAKAEITRRGIASADCDKEAAEGVEFAKNYQLQRQTVNNTLMTNKIIGL